MVLQTRHTRSVSYIFENRFWKWVGLLEDHANVLAKSYRINLEDIFTINQDRPFRVNTRDQVIHAVEAAQEGTFSAAGRTNQRCDLVFRDFDADIFQSTKFTVVQTVVNGFKFRIVHRTLRTPAVSFRETKSISKLIRMIITTRTAPVPIALSNARVSIAR